VGQPRHDQVRDRLHRCAAAYTDIDTVSDGNCLQDGDADCDQDADRDPDADVDTDTNCDSTAHADSDSYQGRREADQDAHADANSDADCGKSNADPVRDLVEHLHDGQAAESRKFVHDVGQIHPDQQRCEVGHVDLHRHGGKQSADSIAFGFGRMIENSSGH
jgi:hypothetical protein